MSTFSLRSIVACFSPPNFSQTSPNITDLCSNELKKDSVCDIGNNQFEICNCNMDVQGSFFVIPECDWDVYETTTEISSTIDITTTVLTTTDLKTTESTTSELITTAEFITTENNENSTNFEEHCTLDVFQYEADPMKTVHMVYKLPIGDLVGGVIYAVECDKGYILENTKTSFEKMRCICKEGKPCRKSNNFNESFGRCIPNDSDENDDDIEDETDNQDDEYEQKLHLDLNLNLAIKLFSQL